MAQTLRHCFTLLAGAALVATAGCGDSIQTNAFDEDATTDTAPQPDGAVDSPASDGAPEGGGCGGAGGCDDHLSCTVDTCVAGACQHVAGPSTGATACPVGQFCDVLKGCVAGVACADTAQCEAKLGGDACKVALACDPATSVCTYQTLDKDHDGHPPAICGGDDCDDSDPKVYSGAPEICDGKANACAGVADQGATCAGLEQCISGACQCPAANRCGGACVDTKTDGANCGTCGNKCGSGATCTNGACVCGAGAVTCGAQCVDLKTDPANCNGCGNTCAPGVACVGGTCTCTKTQCAGKCVDTKADDANCGGCGVVCGAGKSCQGGACTCAPGTSLCGGKCVDLKTDLANCGSCGSTCSGTCAGGVCQACTTVDLFFLMDQSGSMSDGFSSSSTSPTKYQATIDAIDTFTHEPASASMRFALGLWPLASTTPVPPTCITNTDCGPSGICFAGTCLGGAGDSCTAADYQVPVVAFGPASSTANAIRTALAGKSPNGSSTPPPGLQGVLTYAKQWAASNPTHKVVVVAIADGAPNVCSSTSMLSDLEPIATTYSTGTPKVSTYVIGLPNAGDANATAANWNKVAVAGGTGTAFLPTSQATVLSALQSIRGSLKTCP